MTTSHKKSHAMDRTQKVSPGDTTLPLTGAKARSIVMRHILNEIRLGHWQVGSKIATEVDLAEQLGVSKSMVNQAVKEIEKDGVVVRYRRRGTFVAKLPATYPGKTMERTRAQSDRVHILSSVGHKGIAVHWNSAALYQLETVLNAAGLQVIHTDIPTCPDPKLLGQVVSQLSGQDSRGLIILDTLISEKDDNPVSKKLLPHVIELFKYRSRVVWLNRAGHPLNAWPFDAVSFSPLTQGVIVGQYLRQYLVPRVIVTGLPNTSWSEMRVEGVLVGLDGPGREMIVETQWLNRELAPEDQWDIMLKDMVRRKDRPTFVAPNDIYAVALIEAARKFGLSCPEHYGVISFDNAARCRHYNITTAAPALSHLGEAIGMLISDQVRHPANSAIHLTLNSELLERSTFSYPSKKQ